MKVHEDQTAKNAGRKHSPCMNQNILERFYAKLPKDALTRTSGATVPYNRKFKFKCLSRNRAESAVAAVKFPTIT